MDHSTQTYLMGRSAGFLDFYPRSQGEDEIVASVSCFARAL
jgi:cytochrome oxidase Cu insertion factor (SCO1/SenC/PrrC family)